jgi:deazaflavin-dependent oxidoreductase (nitroreductase family)
MSERSTRERILKRIGESGFWRFTGRIHARLYLATHGRIGAHGGGLDHLLLTTTGRRSGRSRTTPLTYLRDGTRFVIVASNGGADRPPCWFLNLRDDPRVRLDVDGERLSAHARIADTAERARLWPLLIRYNPFYADYARITKREIPVVVCEPNGSQ